MKKLFVLFVALLMLSAPIVLAEEPTENNGVGIISEDIITEELSVDGGTTPDSPLRGIDRAIERLEIALTFGKAANAKKKLLIARERLAEIRVMAKAKKIDALEKAQKAHDEILAEAEEDFREGRFKTLEQVKKELGF